MKGLRETAKKPFFSGPDKAYKDLLPPPLQLSGHIFFDFFKASKKVIFFLSGQTLNPPPLEGGPLKKAPFLQLPLGLQNKKYLRSFLWT